MNRPVHILIIGMGSLGRLLALGLAGYPEVGRLTLASRNIAAGRTTAALVAACGEALVGFEPLDARDPLACERLLRRERYDLVIQAGGLLAPWALQGRQDRLAQALRTAGFAVRLCAQLPLISAVMVAVRETGFTGPVVNCSFPDVVNPVLARQGLAPTTGIGNVAMILSRARAALRAELITTDNPASPPPLMRVLAHHAQVDAAMNGQPDPALPGPQIFLAEEGRRADRLAYAGEPLPVGEARNLLTATGALPALRALLPDAAALRTSLPGPNGLPGGYPVRIAERSIALDLPPGLSLEAAVAFQEQSARSDGVESIAPDGTVTLTAEARAPLAQVAAELGEPLHPHDALARFSRLAQLLI